MRLSSTLFFFVISVIFFQWFRLLRDLHSFPTRRSSDLSSLLIAVRKMIGMYFVRSRDLMSRANARNTSRRSEEHTSELQSLTNLVCRLLLEKKKQNKTRPNQENISEIQSMMKDTCRLTV